MIMTRQRFLLAAVLRQILMILLKQTAVKMYMSLRKINIHSQVTEMFLSS